LDEYFLREVDADQS